MENKTKVALYCCVGAIPPFLLLIPPLLIKNNYSTSLTYAFMLIAMLSKFLIFISFVLILIFMYYSSVKNKKQWEFLFPPLALMLLSFPAYNLSNNLYAKLYLEVMHPSQKIIVKTGTWIKENGKPPNKLSEMIPEHLHKIPKQPYHFFSQYHYFVKDSQPTLYVEIPNPPFKKRFMVYTFDRPVTFKIIDTYLKWHLTDHDPKSGE